MLTVVWRAHHITNRAVVLGGNSVVIITPLALACRKAHIVQGKQRHRADPTAWPFDLPGQKCSGAGIADSSGNAPRGYGFCWNMLLVGHWVCRENVLYVCASPPTHILVMFYSVPQCPCSCSASGVFLLLLFAGEISTHCDVCFVTIKYGIWVNCYLAVVVIVLVFWSS